jgi:oligopeptide/dipeptide ABC transporter ATP-binding protein
LDVTIQKEIMDLLASLKKEHGLTVLLITHNMPLAFERSGRIGVMYAGELVEIGDRESIFRAPRHPYTRALISSVPRLLSRGSRFLLGGQPPDLSAVTSGCAFAPRCPQASERCAAKAPVEHREDKGRVKCFLYGDTV